MKQKISIPQIIAITGALSLALVFNNCAKFESSTEMSSYGVDKMVSDGVYELVEPMSVNDLIDNSLLCSDVGRSNSDPYSRCMIIYIDPEGGFLNANGLNPEQPIASVNKAIENLNIFLSNKEELKDENVYVILTFLSGNKVDIPISEITSDFALLYDTSLTPKIKLAYK